MGGCALRDPNAFRYQALLGRTHPYFLPEPLHGFPARYFGQARLKRPMLARHQGNGYLASHRSPGNQSPLDPRASGALQRKARLLQFQRTPRAQMTRCY
jgi:hypothetical protein